MNKPATIGRSHNRTPALFGYAAVIAAAALWGTSGIFVKLLEGNEAVSATALAFWRDFTTFICLTAIGIAKVPAKLRISRSDWRDMFGMGASLGLFHIFYNLGVMLNGAAVTTIQQAIMPVIVTLVAWYLWQERLTFQKVLAILLAISGAVLVAGLNDLNSDHFSFSNVLLGFSVPCLYAAWNLFGKKVRMHYEALVVLIFAFGIASLLLLPFQFFIDQPWPVQPLSWIWFAGLVGLSTLCAFFLFAVGIGRLQAGIVSILLMSEIAFAVFFAYLLLGERLIWTQVLGAILVIAGVVQLLLKSEPAKQ